VRSLPGKYDQIRSMVAKLKDIGISINFILLCETFLTDINCNLYQLPGYQFICNNRTYGKGGGVAMYICDEFQFSIRDDLTINENQQFETIFAEICYGKSKIVVGEVYRVPNTNEKLSIQRYETILQKLINLNGDVIIGTDQNFNFLDTERRGNTQDILNVFITNGFIPTITKATRICHSTSTLIDNIYIKLRADDENFGNIDHVHI
jgi:hypothetical protein